MSGLSVGECNIAMSGLSVRTGLIALPSLTVGKLYSIMSGLIE